MENKKKKSIILVYGILFVMFNVVYFIIPFKKNNVTWIEYVFCLIAIIASLVITLYAFNNGENLKSKVYCFL